MMAELSSLGEDADSPRLTSCPGWSGRSGEDPSCLQMGPAARKGGPELQE